MEAFFVSDDISHVIQLAVAPVFLLASISGALNVLSLRMGRIIDRGRRLNDMPVDQPGYNAVDIDTEQCLLARRARLIHRAIALSTSSALFVCLVIVFLFVDALLNLHLQLFIAYLFIFALLLMIASLLIFLREISASTNAFCFGVHSMSGKQ